GLRTGPLQVAAHRDLMIVLGGALDDVSRRVEGLEQLGERGIPERGLIEGRVEPLDQRAEPGLADPGLAAPGGQPPDRLDHELGAVLEGRRAVGCLGARGSGTAREIAVAAELVARELVAARGPL